MKKWSNDKRLYHLKIPVSFELFRLSQNCVSIAHSFWCVSPKVYCLSWPWIRYNWTVLSSRNAWYFLNIKLHSFWKETHAFIQQKKYKNMYNFVNLNIVVLESLLLRVLIRGNSTKSFVKIFFLLWNTTKTIVGSCFFDSVIVISLTSSFNIFNGKSLQYRFIVSLCVISFRIERRKKYLLT